MWRTGSGRHGSGAFSHGVKRVETARFAARPAAQGYIRECVAGVSEKGGTREEAHSLERLPAPLLRRSCEAISGCCQLHCIAACFTLPAGYRTGAIDDVLEPAVEFIAIFGSNKTVFAFLLCT